MSGLLLAELTATCNALGYFDGEKYHLEPHCTETAKDLIRYLRRDDATNEIRRFLGRTKLVQTDLIPILQNVGGNKELFDIVLRLLVNLSNPALLVYNEVLPAEKGERNQYLEIVGHLQSYKEAFSNHRTWEVICQKLSELLNTAADERDEDSDRNIERILILVRNILHVPSSSEHLDRPDNDASVHDQVVWGLHQSGMLDLILYIASSSQEHTFFMHIMEVVCLLVREQPPALLARTAAQRGAEEKNQDSNELLHLRNREQLDKQVKYKKYQGSRHSNFGGTFVIKNMKSTSDKDMIYHKPLHTVNNVSLDLEKKKVKLARNRQPLRCENAERRSALSIRLILKQFCIEILNAAYNPLMRYVKDILARGKTQANDESYYFNAMKFFMEFNRHYKFQVKLVSETLSVETFHFIQKNLETWREMMITDKKKIPLWSSRMHLAIKAYKELLYNLSEMDKDSDVGVRDSSRVIKSNIFYVVEYREMLLVLMNGYVKQRFSIQYVRDLMETAHIFLKLIEKFGKNKKLIVQKKVSRKKKKNPKKRDSVVEERLPPEELWPRVLEQLDTLVSAESTMEVVPFDAASDVSLEEQKVEAMKQIQILLKSSKYEEAVAHLRAARDVWPENDCFGAQGLSPEEELACIKEIFIADLGVEPPQEDIREEYDEIDEEEEEDLYPPPIEERTLDVSDFLKSFASPKILYLCGVLLKTFDTNTPLINHCVAKMMHRIAWDCKLPSMLYQASLFRSFQRIFAANSPLYKELATLAIYVMRKFTEIAQTNKKLLVELLFWKSSKDAYDIEEGYGSYQEKSKASKHMWEEHEEDELRRLYSEYQEHHKHEKVSMVEWITNNIIKERTERAVAKKLREMHLVVDKNPKKRQWTEEEEEELKTLFQTHRESNDPVGVILEVLPSRTRRSVNDALLRLGVVLDRADLKKKSSRRPRQPKPRQTRDSSSDESGRSDDDSGRSDDERDEETKRSRAAIDRPRVCATSLSLLKAASTLPYLCEGLQWLTETMRDTMSELDDFPAEVPLLPLADAELSSLEDREFQQFLMALGLFPPTVSQKYWRFPADWGVEEFTKALLLLDEVIKLAEASCDQLNEAAKSIIRTQFGETISMERVESEEEMSDDEVDKSAVGFDALIARHCQEALGGLSDLGTEAPSTPLSEQPHSDQNQSPSARTPKSGKKKHFSLDNLPLDTHGSSEALQVTPPVKRRRKVAVMSDSEDEDEALSDEALSPKRVEAVTEPSFNTDSSDSQAGNTAHKRSHVTLDSDDEPAVQKEEYKKKQAVISPKSDELKQLSTLPLLTSQSDSSEKLQVAPTVKRKRKIAVMSDSEDEAEASLENSSLMNIDIITEPSANIESFGSSEASSVVQKRNRATLDSDDEDPSPLHEGNKKKRAIIESDDE